MRTDNTNAYIYNRPHLQYVSKCHLSFYFCCAFWCRYIATANVYNFRVYMCVVLCFFLMFYFTVVVFFAVLHLNISFSVCVCVSFVLILLRRARTRKTAKREHQQRDWLVKRKQNKRVQYRAYCTISETIKTNYGYSFVLKKKFAQKSLKCSSVIPSYEKFCRNTWNEIETTNGIYLSFALILPFSRIRNTPKWMWATFSISQMVCCVLVFFYNLHWMWLFSLSLLQLNME